MVRIMQLVRRPQQTRNEHKRKRFEFPTYTTKQIQMIGNYLKN